MQLVEEKEFSGRPRAMVKIVAGNDVKSFIQMALCSYRPHCRERFGTERVVPGTITSETESSASGKFIQRSPVVHLNLAARGEPTLGDAVARAGKEGLVCQFVRNEQTCFGASCASFQRLPWQPRRLARIQDRYWRTRLRGLQHPVGDRPSHPI